MKLIGYYDTGGNYADYATPFDVTVFGDTLRDEMGSVMAVRDEYGDWVSPTMRRLGLKVKQKVEDD